MNWIQDYKKKVDFISLYESKYISKIRCEYYFICNKRIIHKNKELFNIEKGFIPLDFISRLRTKKIRNKQFILKNIIKYNLIETQRDVYNNNFITKMKEEDLYRPVQFEPSIVPFHDLNTLYFFYELKHEQTKKNKIIRKKTKKNYMSSKSISSSSE